MNELRGYPMEFAPAAQPVLEQVLNTNDEKFGMAEMKDIPEAAQLGLSWVQQAMTVCSSPDDLHSRKLLKRGFVTGGGKDESQKIADVARTLPPYLQQIAAGIKTGSIILLDSPHERRTDSDFEKSEAFVYPPAATSW